MEPRVELTNLAAGPTAPRSSETTTDALNEIFGM
jgi:hypothetical protein